MDNVISDSEYRAWHERFLEINKHTACVASMALTLADNDTDTAMDILELALEGLTVIMEMKNDAQS